MDEAHIPLFLMVTQSNQILERRGDNYYGYTQLDCISGFSWMVGKYRYQEK